MYKVLNILYIVTWISLGMVHHDSHHEGKAMVVYHIHRGKEHSGGPNRGHQQAEG